MYIPFREYAPNASEVGEYWAPIKLTSHQEQLWAETRASVLWAIPFISDVWYAMMTDEEGKYAWFTDKVPIAATDDRYMYINPNTFFAYPLEQRVFICCHEVMHCVFNHAGLFWRYLLAGEIRYSDGVTLKYIPDLMQITADLIINAILMNNGIMGLPPDAWYDPKQYPPTMSVTDAYRKAYKPPRIIKVPPPPGKGVAEDGKSKGQQYIDIPEGGKSFDQHLRPGKGRGESANEAESKRDPQQWTNAIDAAIQSGRLAGNMPAEMERLFKVATSVETHWEDYFTVATSRALGRDSLSWTYLNPEYAIRGIGFPGKVKFGCDLVVLVDDTSGSINQETTDYFLGIAQGTIENLKPRTFIFCECDMDIHRWEEIEDIGELRGKVRGGGGTDFCPPFERIEKEGLQPDLLIYLTDLEGGYPSKSPSYPVVWACITNHKARWGTTVRIPKKNKNAMVGI